MVRSGTWTTALLLSVAAGVTAPVPADPAPEVPAPAVARPATTGPASTRAATAALRAEVIRAVEMAQRVIRQPKPATVAPPPPRNSLQREQQRQQPPPDPLVPIARGLVGKSGLIGFEVQDVVANDGRHYPFGAPPVVRELDRRLPYLVIAIVDNPTPVQLTPAERKEIQQANQGGRPKYADYVMTMAERRRPSHRLFVATDDPAAEGWGKGDARSLRGTIVAVSLDREIGGYVRANVVMTTERAATGNEPRPPE